MVGRRSSNTTIYMYYPTFVLRIDALLHKGPRAKVDQLDLVGLQVDENVLVLHVPVHDSHRDAVLHGLQHLPEDVARRPLAHDLLLRDVVKEIDVLGRPLHDDVEVLRVLKEVEHADDVLVVEAVQQGHLLGHHLLADLSGIR